MVFDPDILSLKVRLWSRGCPTGNVGIYVNGEFYDNIYIYHLEPKPIKRALELFNESVSDEEIDELIEKAIEKYRFHKSMD